MCQTPQQTVEVNACHSPQNLPDISPRLSLGTPCRVLVEWRRHFCTIGFRLGPSDERDGEKRAAADERRPMRQVQICDDGEGRREAKYTGDRLVHVRTVHFIG